MWRERLNVKVSNAELFLVMELQSRKLTRHMVTQEPFKFDGEEDGVEGTFIDIYYYNPVQLAVFVDNPHHSRFRQESKDELIDKALAKRGILSLRLSNVPPVQRRSDGRLVEWADTIQEILNKF